MWVRGLKQGQLALFRLWLPVAPYVGAWIETNRVLMWKILYKSHPMWVRGLKLLLL